MQFHEDDLYEAQQEEAMNRIDMTITPERGVLDLEELLGEDAEMYNLTEAVDDFYSETGHADVRSVYYKNPDSLYDIIDGFLKPEYTDL